MTLFEAQCDLEALKVEAQIEQAIVAGEYNLRDRLNEIARAMRDLPQQVEVSP